MSFTIPPEICDYIIDHLWDDYHALAICGLTCRAWVLSSRTHLFNFIHLERERKILQLLEILDHPPVASVALAHCVRELSIAWTVARNYPRVLEAALRVLDRLNYVECLHVDTRGIMGWCTQDQLKGRLLTFSPNIRTLRIAMQSAHIFKWEHIGYLFELICGFPKLAALKIDSGYWTHELSPPTLSITPPSSVNNEIEKIKLKDLDVMHVGPVIVNAALLWLCGPAFNLQLRRLLITVDDWIQNASLLQVSALHVMDLRIDWDPNLRGGISQHDLSHYRSLVHLRFETIPGWFDDTNRAQLQSFLSSIESPHLETLAFYIDIHKLANISSQRWHSFDDIFKRLVHTCPRLTIQFHMAAIDKIQDWDRERAQYHTNVLASQLPKTQSERACLVVFFCSHTERFVQEEEVVEVFRFDPETGSI